MPNSTTQNINRGNFQQSFQGIVEKASRPKLWVCAATAAGFVAAVTTTVAFAAPAAATICFAAAIASAISAVVFVAIAGVIWAVQRRNNDNGEGRGTADLSAERPETPIRQEEQEFYNTLDVDAQKFYRTLTKDGRKFYEKLFSAKDGSKSISPSMIEENDYDIKQGELIDIMNALSNKLGRIEINNSDNDDGEIFTNFPTINGRQYANLKTLIVNFNQPVPFRNLNRATKFKTLSIDSTDPANFNGKEIKKELLKLRKVEIDIGGSILDKFAFSPDDIDKLLDNGNNIYIPAGKAEAFMAQVFGAGDPDNPTPKGIIKNGKGEYKFYVDCGRLIKKPA